MDFNWVNSESAKRLTPTDAPRPWRSKAADLGRLRCPQEIRSRGGNVKRPHPSTGEPRDPRRSLFWPLKPVNSLSLERLSLLKMLDAVGLRDHGNAVVAHGEAAGPVFLGIVADRGARWDPHSLIDDCPANPRVPADIDPLEEDRIVNLGKAVDPHVRTEDRALDLTPGNDASL